MAQEALAFVHYGTLSPDQRARIEAIEGIAPEFFASQDELEARIDEPEIVAARDLSPAALARARNLKWFQTFAAGPDVQLYPEMVESPVLLTCAKGNGAVPLAEHAVLLMLMLNKQALRFIDQQRERRWQNFTHGELNGQTCGIVGLGNSGLDLAHKAHAFHMHVLGIRRTPTPTPEVDELYTHDRLEEFCARSDFLVVTAPRTPETMGMIGEAELRAMKPTACVVNFSRGGIVEEGALLRALEEGWIAGAGIDVFVDEPLVPESPFWSAPNAIVTPHTGAVTGAMNARSIDILVENLRRYAAGEELFNIVDKIAGY
jgi:phosphoglycerate dehydrogenase-like enzyme